MKVIRDWREFAEAGGKRGGVLSVGNFDGVHVGHAAMLSAGRAEARRRGVGFTIMTFDPHPGVVLGKGNRPPLVTLEQKIELLSAFGAEVLIVIQTTREFLGMEPEVFLRAVVTEAVGAAVMVEGPTFTFGRGAKGTVEMLRERGGEFGIEVVETPTREAVLSDLTVVNVSSSLVRWLIGQGRVADAAKCLGRAYALRGKVVEGAKRGRTIGFPTANVACEQLLPASGVYGGWAKLADGRVFQAATSVGTNPTFDGKATTVEAFLLDFSGDLYGQVIEVGFERWVREMYTFGGVEALVRQMERDVGEVRGK
ncbi:MAG TPA: riboflavin biosynthesis protein RibF [Phycisphaerae bacterium]|nr:riboflavin biosynthesis protein RibF [Phycisphaerae bacterium]